MFVLMMIELSIKWGDWSMLTVVVNDRWSLNAKGRLSRFDCCLDVCE